MGFERSHSVTISEFASQHQEQIYQFVIRLTDEKAISIGKSVIRASVKESYTDLDRKFATSSLLQFMVSTQEKENKEPIAQQTGEVEKLWDCYKSLDGWKVKQHKKSEDISVFFRKAKGLPLYMYKTVIGGIPADLKTLWNFCVDPVKMATLDKRTPTMEQLEVFSDFQADWYFTTKYPFPFASRDFVIKRYCNSDEARPYILSYSVLNAKKPSTKDYVRGSVVASGIILEKDDKDPTKCRLTLISQTNPGGFIPKWMIAQDGAGYLTYAREIKKYFHKK